MKRKDIFNVNCSVCMCNNCLFKFGLEANVDITKSIS